MKATFIGVPGESHDSLNMYGQQFPFGKAVRIESADGRRKLVKHQHFKVEMEASDQVDDAAIKREFVGAATAALAPVEAEHVAQLQDSKGSQTNLDPQPAFAVSALPAGAGTAGGAVGDPGVLDPAAPAATKSTPAKKPSDGLTIEQLRTALKKAKVTVPATVKSKADLAAMLDAAA